MSSSSARPSSLPPPRGDSRRLPWVSTVARLTLGGVALYAGASKLGDLSASAWAVRAYDMLPDDLADLVGHVLPLAEVLLGLLLVTGLLTRWAAAGFGLLLVAFTIGIVSVWARGIAIDCGCFGDGGPVDPAEVNYLPDLLRDVALLALAAWLVWRPSSRLSLDAALRPVLPEPIPDPDPSFDPEPESGAMAPGRSSDVPE